MDLPAPAVPILQRPRRRRALREPELLRSSRLPYLHRVRPTIIVTAPEIPGHEFPTARQVRRDTEREIQTLGGLLQRGLAELVIQSWWSMLGEGPLGVDADSPTRRYTRLPDLPSQQQSPRGDERRSLGARALSERCSTPFAGATGFA